MFMGLEGAVSDLCQKAAVGGKVILLNLTENVETKQGEKSENQ